MMFLTEPNVKEITKQHFFTSLKHIQEPLVRYYQCK